MEAGSEARATTRRTRRRFQSEVWYSRVKSKKINEVGAGYGSGVPKPLDDETDNEEVAREPQAYFTTFPNDTGNEASAFFPDA